MSRHSHYRQIYEIKFYSISLRSHFVFIFIFIYEIRIGQTKQSALQISEFGFHWVLDNLQTRLNNTLEEIPIISTIKHMIPSSGSEQKRKAGKVCARIIIRQRSIRYPTVCVHVCVPFLFCLFSNDL